MEIKNIYVDIKQGNLERSELPRFAAWLVLKNLAWFFLGLVLTGIIVLAIYG